MYNPAQEISSIDFGAIIGGSLNAVVSAQSQSANTTVDFIKSVGFNTTTTKDNEGNVIESHKPINVAFTYDKVTAPAHVQVDRTASVKVEKNGSGYTDNETKKYSLKYKGTEIPLKSVKTGNGKVEEVEVGNIPDSIPATELKNLTLEYSDNKSITEAAILTLTVKENTVQIPATVQKMNLEVPILTMMPIPFIKIEHADIDFNVKINSVTNTNSSSTSNTKTDLSVQSSFLAKTSLSASFSNQKSTNSSEEVKKDYSLNISIHAVQDDMPAGVSRILDILEESVTATPVA